MALGNDIRFTVTPERVVAAARKSEDKIKIAQRKLALLDDTLYTSAYWDSDTADKRRREHRKKSEEAAKLVAEFMAQTVDLLTIASQYTSTENKSEAVAQQLPDDIF